MSYFTPLVFSAVRYEVGTFAAIHEMMRVNDIPGDLANDLILSLYELHTLRDMEMMKDGQVYFIIDNLITGYKNEQAIAEEMTVPT